MHRVSVSAFINVVQHTGNLGVSVGWAGDVAIQHPAVIDKSKKGEWVHYHASSVGDDSGCGQFISITANETDAPSSITFAIALPYMGFGNYSDTLFWAGRSEFYFKDVPVVDPK
jgi:hypothetical protein